MTTEQKINVIDNLKQYLNNIDILSDDSSDISESELDNSDSLSSVNITSKLKKK